jgi:hypothetical protein
LTGAWRSIQQRWSTTRATWQDVASARFEAETLRPLEAEVANTHKKLVQLAQVVTAARQRVH